NLNQNGKGVYSFLGNGKTITGAFIVDKFQAKEGSSNGGVHQYFIHGQIVRPNGGFFNRSPSGNFTFGIGNFSISIPSGLLILDASSNLKFKSRQGTVGLKKFAIAPRTGVFNMTLDKIPATGASGSGLPLSGTNVTNVDLAFSFTFDLAD